MNRPLTLHVSRRGQRGIGVVGLVILALILAVAGLGIFHWRTTYSLHERREEAVKDLDALTNVRGVRHWTAASLRQRALELLGKHGMTPARPEDLKIELKKLTAGSVRQLSQLQRTKIDLACKMASLDQARAAQIRAAAEEGEAPRGAPASGGCDEERLEQLSFTLVELHLELKLRKAWVSVPFTYDHQYVLEQPLESPRRDPEE